MCFYQKQFDIATINHGRFRMENDTFNNTSSNTADIHMCRHEIQHN